MNVQDIHWDDESDTNDDLDDSKSYISSIDSNAYLGQMLYKINSSSLQITKVNLLTNFYKFFYKLNAPR